MYLASPNHLRIVSPDGNDCVYNIHSRQVESFTKVPGLTIWEFKDKHFFFDK
jgi:hypothetical protein